MQVNTDLSQDHIEALKVFADRGEREPPFLFVGRRGVFDDIERQLHRTRDADKTLANARIIQGPPGSGKTSILSELDSRYSHGEGTIPVRLSGEELDNSIAVATAFIRGCGFSEKALGEAHQTSFSGHAGVRWAGISGSYGSLRISPLECLARGVPVLHMLDDYIDLPRTTIFLVLVDETQRIVPNEGHKANKVGVALADGNTGDLKSLTVFGGLSDTGAQLAQVGVSPSLTQNSPFRLEALDEQDVRDLLSAFFQHTPFGLDRLPRKAKSQITDAIVTASECYPRHLHGYMRAFALDLSSHRQINVNRLLESGHEIRIRYYDDLLKFAKINNYVDAISRLVRRKSTDEEFTLDELERVAREECGMSSDDVREAHEKAIHGGILEEDATGSILDSNLRLPVPSFRSYAETGFDRTLTLKRLRDAKVRDMKT